MATLNKERTELIKKSSDCHPNGMESNKARLSNRTAEPVDKMLLDQKTKRHFSRKESSVQCKIPRAVLNYHMATWRAILLQLGKSYVKRQKIIHETFTLFLCALLLEERPGVDKPSSPLNPALPALTRPSRDPARHSSRPVRERGS